MIGKPMRRVVERDREVLCLGARPHATTLVDAPINMPSASRHVSCVREHSKGPRRESERERVLGCQASWAFDLDLVWAWRLDLMNSHNH